MSAPDTLSERTPIGDAFTDRVAVLMEKLDTTAARLTEAAAEVDSHWMADVDATVETEHAKVADEIAAQVVIELATVPLEIDIPGYRDEPVEEARREDDALAVLTTWTPTESEVASSITRGVADVEAGRVEPLPWVTKGLSPEPTEAELIAYQEALIEERRGDIEEDTEIAFRSEEDWREVDAKIIRSQEVHPDGLVVHTVKQRKIGPPIPPGEVTQRLRKPSPAPRAEDEK